MEGFLSVVYVHDNASLIQLYIYADVPNRAVARLSGLFSQAENTYRLGRVVSHLLYTFVHTILPSG